jgi:flagella basal body P-ring formation protein FlgA
MSLRAHQRTWPAFAALAAASVAGAGDATSLEERLRAARPEILRWQTQPLDARAVARGDTNIVAIGRVGARTPVRYADGHVAWFAVVGMGPVMVSTHSIDARESVAAQDATLEERDVLALGCEPIQTFEPGTRWRTTRHLAAGAPLCVNDLEHVPDVERDRPVTLTTQRGAIQVSRVFTAAADARTGERVRLRDRESGATLVAIVTGPGLARDPDSEELR